MKCPECGNEVYPDQIVCGYCGAPNPRSYGMTDPEEKKTEAEEAVSEDAVSSDAGEGTIVQPSSAEQGTFTENPSEGNRRKGSKKKVILIAAIFLAVCAIGGGIWLYLSKRDTPHIKLMKKYIKAYEEADVDTFLDVLIPKIRDKKIKDRDNMPYSEMVRELFQEMKETGDRFTFEIEYKMDGKPSDEEVEKTKSAIAKNYGDVKISDLRIVKLKGKKVYKNGTFTHTEPYEAYFMVGKYDGEMKIFNYSTSK